jgi:putative solute:sodium symporter small subunit
MAAQGASLAYLAIIGAYAWRMRRLDREFARQTGAGT